MRPVHTLLGACLLFSLTSALQTSLAYSCKKPPYPDSAKDCADVEFGPGISCTLKTPDQDREDEGCFRFTLLTFPKTWSPDQVNQNPYPLILSFHGRTKSSAEQEKLTGLSDNNINAIVAYPQGRGNEWQGDPRIAHDINDVGFVTNLIQQLTDSHIGINLSRVYSSGKSNGGGFQNLLACDSVLSNKIAAFAAASGAFYEDGTNGLSLPPCLPKNDVRPIPFMEFHGTGDCTIQYGGGTTDNKDDGSYSGVTRPVFDVVSHWGSQKGSNYTCTQSGPPSSISCHPERDIEMYTWSCGGVADTVVHYKIAQLGHDWPSKGTNDDCKTGGWKNKGQLDECPLQSYCPTCIDATSIMLEWFQKFSVPAPSPPLDHHTSSEDEL